MNIIYICYWGLKEGLTQSTVIPHLKILVRNPNIRTIYFITVERNVNDGGILDLDEKVDHHTVNSIQNANVFLTKINDLIKINRTLKSLIKNNRVDFMIARSSLAGIFAGTISKKTGIPYVVESFEPHADYMLESGVWKKYDPRYLFQRFWEKRQLISASHLMTVSHNYTQYLISKGIDASKITTMPCAVDIKKFSFSNKLRQSLRSALKIGMDEIVGIYVGKFGGIYMDKDAFDVFLKFEEIIKGFRLIILTPINKEFVISRLDTIGFPLDKVIIKSVPFDEVPSYLSASDFAFSLIKTAEIRKYCSPIKDGEYWANGLLVFIPDNIGDDSEIVRKERAGVVFTNESLEEDSYKMVNLINSKNRLEFERIIKPLAIKHRSFNTVEIVYDRLIDMFIDRKKNTAKQPSS